jgi:hypothetical protein
MILAGEEKIMYIEIKTDSIEELVRTFEATVKKGQQAMLTLSRDGDFYSLSVNDSLEAESPDATS